MKITRQSIDYEAQQEQRIQANLGCDICPCCGENTSHFDYIHNGIYRKGVWHTSIPSTRVITKGFFKHEVKHVDTYECLTCGAKWESDPY